MTLATGTKPVFINIGWMVSYAGQSASDPTIGKRHPPVAGLARANHRLHSS